MKHFASLITLTVLATAMAAFAQYPAYQWINSYDREEIGRQVVYSQEFEHSQSFTIEGKNQCVITPTPEGLKVVSQGVDPYFWTPAIASKDGQPMSEMLEFSLTMQSNCGTTGQIFWSEDIHDGFDENRSVRFDVINDDEFRTYTAKVLLAGQLRKIRIDPGSGKGTAVISKFEITQIERMPIEITNMVSDQENFQIEITNHSEQLVHVSSAANPNEPIGGKSKMTQERKFPQKEPFEALRLHLYPRGTGVPISRVAYAFHENLETKWIEIGNEKLTVLVAQNLSGAKILKEGKTIGIISPLIGAWDKFTRELSQMKVKQSDKNSISIEYVFFQHPIAGSASAPGTLPMVGSFSLKVVDNEIQFELSHDMEKYGPVFRPLGTMEQAVLAGVEYLERGEHSSSTADIETPEHLRVSPDPLKMTMPFMGIITDKASFGLLWDDPLKTHIQFATPDFLEGKQPGDLLQNRMGIFGSKIKGVLRVGNAYGEETMEDAVLWAVKKRGVPPLPPVPRSLEAQQKLNLAGLTESELYKDGKWAHAILPGSDMSFFSFTNSADCVSTIWQITGQLPVGSREYARGGAHQENPNAYFLTGSAQQWLDMIHAQANGIRRQQQADGSFLYNGKYLKGHWDNKASGHCGNLVVTLFNHYRYTGNGDSLAAAIKGTDFLNTFRVPRGAQTWELSLHTPDIMGSAWCCIANVRAFEETGKREYLKQAVRWASSGLPFVYQWQTPLAGKELPVMLYATTPVLGATDWVAPNWIGLPVQWCGLDYAEALFLLAPHDMTIDWKQVAEGILIAGELMQYEKGPSIGLLPDSWTIKTQTPNPFDINPVVLERLRRRANAELHALDMQISPDGKNRVVSPLPIRFDGNEPVVDGAKGLDVQILVNGKVSSAKTINAKTVSEKKKQIVFIGGPKSHGYGMHTHTASFKLLADWLNTYTSDTQSKVYVNGWPNDPTAIDDADCVVVYCDGGAGHIAIPHLDKLKKHAAKGGGIVMYHFAVEVPKGEPGDFFLDAIGGYYESFFTTTQGFNAEFKQIPVHPVTRGMKPFSLEEEWYFNIRFRPDMKGVTPLLSAIPPDSVRLGEDSSHFGNATIRSEKGKLEHLAWCVERPDGGRGLGFTGGHWHWSWGHPKVRKFVLNAIAWTAGAEVPENGIEVPTPSWEKLLENQDYEPNLTPEDTARWQEKIRLWNH